MVYTAWPNFEDNLTKLARDDDPQVASEAGLTLEQLVESGVIDQRARP